MASINLVTAHKGTNHITVDNVRDLIAGISGQIGGIKIFTPLDDGLAHTITDLLEITIKTGQALAGGYHFQLTSDYVWNLDALATGYSRIDVLYLVIYQDNMTLVQSADFVYQVGTAYQNGTAGTEPSAPTGTTVLETFKFLRVDLTDGAIVSMTDYSTPYLSNTAVENEFSGNIAQITANTNALNGFRFGIDANGNYGYKKVGADTVTPFRNPIGNATAADVLKPKTFSNSNGDNITGSMTDRGNITTSINPNGSYTIPQGYPRGSGRVSCPANTGEYKYPSGSVGSRYDMGISNLNRYVDATNVYAKGKSDGVSQGRSDKSSHTISCEIIGNTQNGFNLLIMCDGVMVDAVSATGSIGEQWYVGSGVYGCDLTGALTAKTSYSGGLSV